MRIATKSIQGVKRKFVPRYGIKTRSISAVGFCFVKKLITADAVIVPPVINGYCADAGTTARQIKSQ